MNSALAYLAPAWKVRLAALPVQAIVQRAGVGQRQAGQQIQRRAIAPGGLQSAIADRAAREQNLLGLTQPVWLVHVRQASFKARSLGVMGG